MVFIKLLAVCVCVCLEPVLSHRIQSAYEILIFVYLSMHLSLILIYFMISVERFNNVPYPRCFYSANINFIWPQGTLQVIQIKNLVNFV